MKVKYIVVDNMSQLGDTDGMIIFPEYESHVSVAEKYGGRRHVLSAGFCNMGITRDEKGNPVMGFDCYGESVSLKKEWKPGDSDILKRMFENDY